MPGWCRTRRSTRRCANGAQPGQVDNQNPAQGTQVANDSTVNISVCQGTTTTSTSSTTTTTTELDHDSTP